MSKIIKPQQKTIKRIQIDIDSNGQAQVNGQNVLNGGPLHPMDVVLNLLQIATGMLAGALAQSGKPIFNGENNGENTEKSH